MYACVHTTDINECIENTNGCAQTCTNTAGSFRCVCDLGYELNSDERTCQGKSAAVKIILWYYLTCNTFARSYLQCILDLIRLRRVGRGASMLSGSPLPLPIT